MLLFVTDVDKLPFAEQLNPSAVWVLVALVILESLTLLGYLFSWYIYPQLALHPAVDPVYWWQIRFNRSFPANSADASMSTENASDIVYEFCFMLFEYHWFWRTERQFSYCGELDPMTKKPHGYGTWTDNSRAGEYLTGYWADGVPVGPFKSNEYATGFSFRNLRVAFCRATADHWADWAYFPERPVDGKASYGVVGVECSLAGKFFLELPKADLLHDNVESLSAVIELMDVRLPDDDNHLNQITITLEDDDFFIPGYVADNSEQLTSQLLINRVEGKNRIQINGWKRTAVDAQYEALIFIPGFNSPLQTATERIGQMLALNNFPPQILTFVFNWPAGRIITYHTSLASTEYDLTLSDFTGFIRDLHATGKISCFHILTHSMGARLALNASDKFPDLFSHTTSSSSISLTTNDKSRPRLATFTLFNPEADLDAFCQSHYSNVYQVCNNISLFVDESDGALGWAELMSRQRMLGRYATQYLRRQNRRASYSFIADRPSLVGPLSQSSSNSSIPSTTAVPPVTGDQKQRKPLLRLAKPNMSFVDYDLDIMDMTQLDASIHDLRHCYFNINRNVLDDLRDIIVHKKRARYRQNRLLKVDSNVYTYISAPSFLVNK